MSKFVKARPDKTFQALVKEACDYALADLEISQRRFTELVDGSVASYFSDHFTRQLMAGIMAQDYPGLVPKPSHRVEAAGARLQTPLVRVAGIGRGTDAMRMADRPHQTYETFLANNLLPYEDTQETRAYYRELWNEGFRYPGVHSFRAGRMGSKEAYERAGITDPLQELDFIELHDAYTSSEIQTYEDMGLCRYGEGGEFATSGKGFVPGVEYKLGLPEEPACPVNPSGGLLACGHPVGATGLM